MGAVAVGALASANYAAARRAERRHPPEGSFIEINGVRLHYSDRGTGRPVVLIHGNAVTGDDYNTSVLCRATIKVRNALPRQECSRVVSHCRT